MLLFVYGTLQKGCKNHHYLNNATFLTHATSLDYFRILMRKADDYPEGYPVAIPDAEGLPLGGEIYQITEEVLIAVDGLEDYPLEYNRKQFPFACPDGRVMNAWIYFGKDE